MARARTYRPTSQARLQLRLDEGPNIDALKSALEREREPGKGTFGVTVPATEQGIADARDTNIANKVTLGQSKSVLSPTEFNKQSAQLDKDAKSLQLAQFGGQPNTVDRPESLREEDANDLNVLFAALPINCSIERTSVREPDTAEVTFDYRDIPVDPRSIRAGLVSLVIGSVSEEEYQRGIVGREERTSDGMLVSIVERSADEELKFTGSSSRFVGFVDEWHVELGDDGDVVVLTMRDITALFIDQKMQDGITIDLSKPLDEGIRDFVNIFPSLRGTKVFFGTPEQFATQEFDPVTPPSAPVPRDSLPDVALSRGGKKAKGQKKGDQEDNVWDHIVTTCAKLGFIAFVRGFVVYIVEPRNLFDQVANGRKMVFGRNIKQLEFDRKMAGVTTQTIEVRSPDPDIGRTRWARFPVLDNEPSSGILGDPDSPQPVVSRPQKVSPNGKPDEQVMVVNVARVTDLQVLERIAENTFQEIGRQEIEGSFETDDLDSFKETAEDERAFAEQDLLSLYPGDPVTLLYAPPDTSASGNQFQQTPKKGKEATSSAQELIAMTFARRRDYLAGLGMSRQAAERLAAVAEGIPLANSFRVGTMSMSFDVEEGISITCSFYNFITVRELGRPDGAGVADQRTPPNISSLKP